MNVRPWLLAVCISGMPLFAQDAAPEASGDPAPTYEIPPVPPEVDNAAESVDPLSPPPGPLGAPRSIITRRKKARLAKSPSTTTAEQAAAAEAATPPIPEVTAPPAAGSTVRKPSPAVKPKNGKNDGSKEKSASDSALGLNVDYVDEPILDVLRAIATAYRLSIIPDKDIGDVKVTIHLEKIPVIEGLEKLCRSHGLELAREGNVYRVHRLREPVQSVVQLRGGKLFLDVKNKPVRDFLREFGEKTGINIVAGQGLRGAVTGQLRDVGPLDGLKALMAANNYTLRQRSGVYLVEMADSSDAFPNFGGRRRPPGGPTTGSGEVDVHDGKVTLNCRNSQLADVIREISEQANLNYSVIGDLNGTVNAQLKDVSVDEALVNILKGTRFTFIRTQGTLLIGDRNPNTPSGQALSGVELVYLKYVRAENLEKLLPKSSQDNVKVVKEQNALLISGTGEDIAQAKEFVEKVDLPTPQVLLEVVVVEYNRQKDSQLGVGEGKTNNLGPNLNMTGSFSGIHDEFNQGSFRGAIGLLPPRFDLSLRALESQNRAHVLAMPKITTLNGNKAELRVTRTFYYKVSSVTKDGFQNNDFRAIDDGITIEITPWITKHGEVNVNVTPTIKTAGQAVENSPAPVTNRSITTNVELRDGETLALGGLITSQEDNQRKFVPILGSIPLLGWLFSYRQQLKITTELVIYVTPHVLKADDRGVQLEEEFKAMDKRGGIVKPEDIILKGKTVKAASRDTSVSKEAPKPAAAKDSAKTPVRK